VRRQLKQQVKIEMIVYEKKIKRFNVEGSWVSCAKDCFFSMQTSEMIRVAQEAIACNCGMRGHMLLKSYTVVPLYISERAKKLAPSSAAEQLEGTQLFL